ncbi:non-homologous end joining protein Ku [Rhodovulum sp. PH10]|uniref:non-homologous end joining protein Ku n=1 Tax=Rhodovulum sp. PH10 TaxID=1187851 RepID=UPI000A065625|nr:Ku protein [Rhodovulum sp. PH10]
MAPRANWKGHLRLSLVSCPVALYPATSDSQKVRFHLIDRETGHRIRMQKVDAETGDPVEPGDIVRGYETDDGFVEITDEDLSSIALDSSRTIDITRFVPRSEIDDLYNVRPYYIVPDGAVGQQAFAVIREAIRQHDMVALGRVVLSTREHVIALEPRGKGLLGTLLRYPYEVRDERDYFDDIPEEKTPKEMIALAGHIIETMKGDFSPDELEDRYETALRELIERKAGGETITPQKSEQPAKVVSLMDALKRSIAAQDDGGSGSSGSGSREAGSGGRSKAPASRSASGSRAKSSRGRASSRSGQTRRKAG